MADNGKKLDPRILRTRKLIESSFLELLEEEDFQSITIQDITDRATINRSTFYAHFDDKYMLFDHIIRQTFMQSIKSKVPLSAEFSMKNLRSLIIAVCDYLTRLNWQYHPTDLQLKPVIETQVQSQLYKILLNWIKPLETDFENLNPSSELTASMLSWSIYGIGLQCSQLGELTSVEEVADQALDLLSGALFSSPSIESLEVA
ncbi:MAG: TetR/AcrR family transcriptional regulator [Chloroflexi bacterium]|nr:TetR/AcrR family transcriptional regulator [Chloroflexota bacterium]